MEDRIVPASFVVNSIADSGAGSLRAAVISANGSAGLDTITFTGAAFASNATITLTSGELAISDSVNIDGTSKGTLTISGNNASRVFNINNAVAGSAINVSMNNLILTKGATIGSNDGGAIFDQDENLTLTGCTLTANSSANAGGVIRVEAGGKLLMDTCIVTSNSASSSGGALSIAGAPTVTIDNSTFSSNVAVSGGGVNMFQGGSLTVTGCTFNTNSTTTSDGGALFLNGTFTTAAIRNSTLSGNVASSDGGAIALGTTMAGNLGVQNCTIASNVATNNNGGGIARTGGTATITLVSSIIFSNNAGTTADNLFTTGNVGAQFCLITNTTGVTTFGGDSFTNSHIGVNPLINVLASNGGSAQTRSLQNGSPAIDAGSNPAALSTDQRGTGYFRTRGMATDIGAFETPDDFVVTNTSNSGAGSLRQAVLDANSAVGIDTITFDSTVFTTTKTITLTSGELLISEGLTINGPAALLIISGNNAGRVFDIQNALAVASVTIRDMTINGGKVTGANDGGAIFTTEPLTLSNVNVSNSTSADEGGGIRVSTSGGSLSLDSCTLSGNSAVKGGGVASDASSAITIKNSTFSNNSVSGSGGGIAVLGAAAVSFTNSTFSANTAASGGAAAWTLTANNNSFYNCTLTGNSASGGKGGGVYAAAGTVSFDSSIVSGNSGANGPDISNPGTNNVNFSAIGSSIGFTLTGANNLAFGTNLLLGVLQTNGGVTRTHAPAVNSPVLGKGSNVTSATTDQRGTTYPRLRGTAVDIGAVEVNQLTVTNVGASGVGSLTQAVLDSNAHGGRDTITFDPAIFATTQTIAPSAELLLTEDAEIQGPAARVLVSGSLAHRIVQITNGTNFDFSNLNLALGAASSDGGAVLIANTGNQSVTFTNCSITLNSAAGNGGGVAGGNDFMSFVDCTVNNNQATGVNGNGGGIALLASGSLSLTRCTVAGNTAAVDGGGVHATTGASTITFLDSTLSGNSSSDQGGGIHAIGTVSGTNFVIRNTTLSGNKSTNDGGGLAWTTSSGAILIQNSTITNNTAGVAAGGGGLSVATGTGNLNIESTIVSGNSNSGAPDIDNPNTTSVKTSAIGDNLGFAKTDLGGNLPFQAHANLKLGVLAANGGPTMTHVPQTGSPLINVGSNPASLTSDQRGFPRALGTAVEDRFGRVLQHNRQKHQRQRRGFAAANHSRHKCRGRGQHDHI
ncbi:MAG: beta strand repeat-containing protein [Gemmataceae bacterium]